MAAAVTISTTSGVFVATSIVAPAAPGVSVAASIAAVVTPGITVAVVVVGTTVVAAVVIAPTVSTTAAIVAVSATAVVATAVPRADADKDAADKVVRTVKTIRCAFVRVVVVVSIRANGSCADVAVPPANTNVKGNLRLCVTCGEHENAD